MNMDKKKVTMTLALTVGLTYTSAIPSVTYAHNSLHKIKSQEASAQSLKAQLSAQQKKIQNDLKAFNKKQLALTSEISAGQSEINQTNDKIEALKSEISVIQKRVDARKKVLDQRLVSIYKNGTTDYLDVLFGAKDFNDFVTRFKALHMITSQDHKILTDQKNDKEAVAIKQKSVEAKQAANVARLEKLKKALADVEALQVQKKIASKALSLKQTSVSARLTALNNAEANLSLSQVSSNIKATSFSSADNSGNSSSDNSASDNSSAASGSTQTQSPAISASVASGGISGILNYGNRFIGNSTYVFGASNPAGHQFDCSGFVHAAFAANGIGVGRTTGALVSQGSAVSINQAKPGDLVFFDTYKTNGHVGIYLGGGRFIGSQSSTGVAVVSMSNPYWRSHFSGVVRRVLN
ncbi:C40 family peptidase [Sporolactobacillus spathodeae]|uniref:Peptidoglycan hydrolase CwlO-like protein n=1 Tax=Sporolactobacillus spathodeae TaxID=1465502 RepID=A0ABS2Q6B1_9BACL|nr:C40 family peptidase [Sporolactobacillus spathodeae]MBM7656739.1 peptidoglycan hydrolase CwlO-like protein [Sporolactobacillus spathodeae]